MFTHERPTPARRRARGLRAGLAATATTLVLAASAAPAAADTPTAWEQPPEVSVLGFLLVLVILPVGLALVIALLSVLPSLAGDKDYEGGGWRGDAEWFGAPTKGVGAADSVTPEQLEASSKGSGGTSASW